MQPDKYAQRGVASGKEDVHKAIAHLSKGLYSKAFCKVLPDYLGQSPQHCLVSHVDTAGTKPALAYLYWRETADLTVWEGIVQDALVMNLDDMACAGVTNHFVVAANLARNKHLIPGEVVQRIISHTQSYLDSLQAFGLTATLAGGETADVGDIVRTADVGFTVTARAHQNDIIEVRPQPGDVIVGFSSAGRCSYEPGYNSGIGCNGLTSARHDLLHPHYASQYPETYSPETPREVIYTGPYRVQDSLPSHPTLPCVGKLILSPTRLYLPLIHTLLTQHRNAIHGLVHCTGGGQTKVLHFAEGVQIIKDNLLPVPPLFEEIQRVSATPWREMFRTFNMGHRLEAYTTPKAAPALIQLAHNFGIESQVVGRVQAHPDAKATLRIHHQGETLEYVSA
jgi:phosphoribosylformylglycinamidine cyclo-ligase